MSDAIQDSLRNHVTAFYQNSPKPCSQALAELEQAFIVLHQEGIALTSLRESTCRAAATDTGLHPQRLACLLDALKMTQPAGPAHPLKPLVAASAASPSFCSTSSSPDHHHHPASPNSVAGRQCCSNEQLQWVPASQTHPCYRRCAALYVVHRWLVLLLSPGSTANHHFQRLLAHESTVQALQGVLPFVTLEDVIAGAGTSANLLSHLPAALRAWLLADVAAGLLLAVDGRCVPDTPQHSAALLALLTSLSTPPGPSDGPSDDELIDTMATASSRQLMQQQCGLVAQSVSTWDAYKDVCGNTVAAVSRCSALSNPPVAAAPFQRPDSTGSSHYQQQPQCHPVSPAAALLTILQSHLASSGRTGATSPAGIQLPTHVASALAADISLASHDEGSCRHEEQSSTHMDNSTSSSSSCEALHACLSHMAVAAVCDLEQAGLRAGVTTTLVNKQQLHLQWLIAQMLLPLQQLLQPPGRISETPPSPPGTHQQEPQHAGETGSTRQTQVLQLVLGRVQTFIKALHNATSAQRLEVWSKLREQLLALSQAAVRGGQDASSSSSSNLFCSLPSCHSDQPCSSSSTAAETATAEVYGTAPATSAAPAAPAPAYHFLSTPDFVELVGAGCFEALLQMSLQHTPRPSHKDHLLTTQRLGLIPAGSPLSDFSGTMHMVEPGHLLHYWRALAAASDATAAASDASPASPDSEEVGCPSSSSMSACQPWSVWQVDQLLLDESGLGVDEAQEASRLLADTLQLLQLLDWASATAACEVPVVPLPELVRSSASCSSIPSSGHKTEEVLPAFAYQCRAVLANQPSLSELLNNVDEKAGPGLLAEFNIVSLLVRAALLQLPDLQQQHGCLEAGSKGSAAATQGDRSNLQRELLTVLRARLLKMQQIGNALQAVRDIMQQPQHQLAEGASNVNGCSTANTPLRALQHQIRSVLEQLLAAALPGCDCREVSQQLLDTYKGYQILRASFQKLLQPQESNSDRAHNSSSSNSNAEHDFEDEASSCVVPAATAAAIRALVAWSSVQLQQVIQGAVHESYKQQLQPLLEQYTADWGPLRSGSSNKQGLEYLLAATTDLLDPMETLLCRLLLALLQSTVEANRQAEYVWRTANSLQCMQRQLLACIEQCSLMGMGRSKQWQECEVHFMHLRALQEHLVEASLLNQHQSGLVRGLSCARNLANSSMQLLASMYRALHAAQHCGVLHREPQHDDDDQQQQQHESQVQQLVEQCKQLLPRLSMLQSTLSILSITSADGDPATVAQTAAKSADNALAALLADHAADQAVYGGLKRWSKDLFHSTFDNSSTHIRDVLKATTEHQHELQSVRSRLSEAALGLLGALGTTAVPGISSSCVLAADIMKESYGSVTAAICQGPAVAAASTPAGACGERAAGSEIRTLPKLTGAALKVEEAQAAMDRQLLQIGNAMNASQLEQLVDLLLKVLQHIDSDISNSNNDLSARQCFELLVHRSDATVNHDPHADEQQPGTASSGNGSISGHSVAAPTSQLTADPNSGAASLHAALWQVIMTLKPSLALSLRITDLSEPVQRYTYECAVLGFPLAAYRQQQQHQEQRELQCLLLRQHLRLQQLVAEGPPAASDGWSWDDWRLLLATLQQDLALGLQDATFRTLAYNSEHDCCEPTPPTTLQKQYSRALQVSFCKSGSPAGLIRQLLLLEAIRHPGEGSLLHPKLLPAWREQHSMELSRVLVPQGFTETAAMSSGHTGVPGAAEPDLADSDGGLPHNDNVSAVAHTDVNNSSSEECSECSRRKCGAGSAETFSWHTKLLTALTKSPSCIEEAQVESYTSACRLALCCWVLCWHCCVEERQAKYDCVITRAAAAEAASDLLGTNSLQHIRLPSWTHTLPSKAFSSDTSEADASCGTGARMHTAGNSVWWQSWTCSSSSSSSLSNQTWSQVLSQQPAASSAADAVNGSDDTFPSSSRATESTPCSQQLCDHCGKPASTRRRYKDQCLGSAAYYCPGCGVAVYCSRSCADRDKQQHRPGGEQCRLLSCAASKEAGELGWSGLTAMMASASQGHCKSLVAGHP